MTLTIYSWISLVKEYVVGVWDAHKQKLYSDDLFPSQLQSLAEDLQLAGVERQLDGKLCSSGEGGTDGKDLPVCVALPMIVGVWSMAVMLWQPYEYYIGIITKSATCFMCCLAMATIS